MDFLTSEMLITGLDEREVTQTFGVIQLIHVGIHDTIRDLLPYSTKRSFRFYFSKSGAVILIPLDENNLINLNLSVLVISCRSRFPMVRDEA